MRNKPPYSHPSAIRVPVLKRRKKPKRTRLRKHQLTPLTLTEVVRRILIRVYRQHQVFGVFIINDQLVMSGAAGKRFNSLSTRWPGCFIGAYDRSVSVVDLVDDLKGYFKDGALNVPN
ncbi:hypothetical protein NB640_02795 [Oxalobacter vibrioformis]|uniref:Uncharacterized protein n=1 Tax=Oxalobacter vibrioformis TaxID=933080 RepID=A0A9E9P3T9_9BURK|nr:hypothetical protein [Oxalobacter vibrioformis]WAW10605.1 hypothetical protein NB640_02795 [Oxalobacter vibrioformis]